MTLQQLKYFRVMAEVLHYTQAAKTLYISQSSLSYSLSELEKELGAPLFGRQGKRTLLTKYGEAFLPFAEKSLDSLEEGTRLVEKMLEPVPQIDLGYIYSLSFNFLPQTLTGFLELPAHADITFNFYQGMSSAIIDRLKRGQLELAFSLETGDEAIDSVPVYNQELFLIVPRGHRLTTLDQVKLDDLRDEGFVAIGPNSNLRQHLDNIFVTLGATPNITFEAEECNAMASFVGASFGIAIMPEIPALRAYNVEMLPVSDIPLTRKIYLLRAKDRPLSPAAARFHQYLLDDIAH